MKIPCGGFYIDEESLELENNILSVKNGGGSATGFVLPYEIVYDEETEVETWEINGGYEDVKNAICFTGEEGYLYVRRIIPGGEMASLITAFGTGFDPDISAFTVQMYTFIQNEEGTKYVCSFG